MKPVDFLVERYREPVDYFAEGGTLTALVAAVYQLVDKGIASTSTDWRKIGSQLHGAVINYISQLKQASGVIGSVGRVYQKVVWRTDDTQVLKEAEELAEWLQEAELTTIIPQSPELIFLEARTLEQIIQDIQKKVIVSDRYYDSNYFKERLIERILKEHAAHSAASPGWWDWAASYWASPPFLRVERAAIELANKLAVIGHTVLPPQPNPKELNLEDLVYLSDKQLEELMEKYAYVEWVNLKGCIGLTPEGVRRACGKLWEQMTHRCIPPDNTKPWLQGIPNMIQQGKMDSFVLVSLGD